MTPSSCRARSGSRRRAARGRGTLPVRQRWCWSSRPSTALAAPSGVNDGSTSGIVSPATARSSMVTTSSSIRRPFGKPAGVARHQPEGVRVRRRRDRHVEPEHVRLRPRPVKFWNPGTTPAGIPVSRIALQVGAWLRVRRQVREHAGVEHRQQPGQLRLVDVLREGRVDRRRPGVPHVLLGHRHDDLVEQRVAEPGDLLAGPVADVLAGLAVEDPRLAPARRRPDTDDRAGLITSVGLLPLQVSSEIGTWIAIVCTLNDCTELMPSIFASGIRCAWLNGRSPPRSKTLPRSTWNASARWPANTLRPPHRVHGLGGEAARSRACCACRR